GGPPHGGGPPFDPNQGGGDLPPNGGGGNGGGGPPNGGGGPPYAPGGDGGGDPPNGGGGLLGAPYQGGGFDWQINRKLNLSLVPEWDGHGKTAISYVCKIAELLRLSPQMAIDLGAIAPLKFTGRAETWWMTQTPTVRVYLSQSWTLLLQAIQAHFLNANWLQERRCEWEEMRFRQRGHENEWPLDFLQRRLVYHAFLFTDEEDGINVVDRLLHTAPDVWAGTINSERYPDIFTLMAAARRYCATLMGNWTTSQKLGNLNHYYPRRSNRNANAADGEEDSEHGSEASKPAENDRDALAANNFRPRNRPNASTSRMPWPEGKTVRGYDFVRRDDVHSDRPPANGVCYVCSSPKHFARDCPHYGRWLSMRDANLLEAVVSHEQEEADYNEYVAMIAEFQNETSSAYPSESPELKESSTTREVFAVDVRPPSHRRPREFSGNRNERRRAADEERKHPKSLGKRKAEEDRGLVLPRKVVRFKDKHSPSSPTPPEDPSVEEVSSDSSETPMNVQLDGVEPYTVRAVRAKAPPAGFGSLGVRALHIKAFVGSPSALPIKGRLDSGADITLMSETYFNSIPGLPKPREGLRMRLYALTGEAKVLGYTRFTMYARATDGVLISFEVEAYVVRNMRVPLLLGEDFQ
ncbi:hypothetical protein B0H12DRAFT_970000, partial [Mycena haematopus]